jgi:transposase
MGVPPENRDPVLLHPPTRRSAGYFGAVRLRDGRFLYRRETERFGAGTFFDFLRQFHRANRANGRRMVLILDNASYHHARLHRPWREAHADRISFEFLPVYSPELNPIERVWKFTRRRCLHNRYFPQLERVIETVEWELAAWACHTDSLRRLCAII